MNGCKGLVRRAHMRGRRQHRAKGCHKCRTVGHSVASMHTSPPDTRPGVLASIIRERRLELGLSKSAAARKAGVDRGTWHDIENGTRTNMQPVTLNQIDVALDWEVGHLRRLARPLDSPQDDVEEQLRRKLIALAGSLSGDKLRQAVDLVDSVLAPSESSIASLIEAAVRKAVHQQAV